MNNLSANVKKIWRDTFLALWQAVLNDPQVRKKPPALKIEFSDHLNAKCGASLTENAALTIEVSSQFALNLHRELQTVKNGLASLAFDAVSARRTRCGEVLAAVEQLTVGFIVLHEIFHLIGGHFDWLKAKPSSRWTLRERYQEFPPNWHTKPSYSAIADAYLMESEADCSAIQWMLQVMSARKLQRLLQTRTDHIQFFSGRQRLAAFRLLLASVWLAIRRLESAREELEFNNSARHPLPVTRVFAAFGTFLMHYTHIASVRFDPQGGAQHTLTDNDVKTIRQFLQHILSPVLKCDWNPASRDLPPECLEAQLRFYLRDYGNHLLNKPVETIAGRELIRMERARFRMDRSLQSFRYYRSAKLERIAPRGRTGHAARQS